MTQGNEKLENMLATAMEMEEKGYSFYQKAVQNCGTTIGKDIFTMLRDDEIVHIERIKQIYSNVQGQKPWTDEWKQAGTPHRELTQVFREMAHKHGRNEEACIDDIEALKIGIDFEAKAVTFYSDYLSETEDSQEKEFIQAMIKEEKGHHAALMDMKTFLENPDDWFAENERSGLDGA